VLSDKSTNKDRRGRALGLGRVIGAGIAFVLILYSYSMGPQTSIPVALLVWIGGLALGWFSGYGLWSLGINVFGLKAVTSINCVLLLATLGVLGWLAGWFFVDRNVVAGSAGAVCLIIPNLALFYARREYLFGNNEPAETRDLSEGNKHSEESQ